MYKSCTRLNYDDDEACAYVEYKPNTIYERVNPTEGLRKNERARGEEFGADFTHELVELRRTHARAHIGQIIVV